MLSLYVIYVYEVRTNGTHQDWQTCWQLHFNSIAVPLQNSLSPLTPITRAAEWSMNTRCTSRKGDTVSSVILVPPPLEGDFLEIISTWLPACDVRYEYT